MNSAEINPDSWEAAAADRSNWRHVVRTGMRRAERPGGMICGTTKGRDRERGQIQHPRNQHLTVTIYSIFRLRNIPGHNPDIIPTYDQLIYFI